MADILLFPAERALAAAYHPGALQFQAEASVADSGIDAWFEADVVGTGSLETVASLAAVPSQSLAGLATKMEVLVCRATSASRPETTSQTHPPACRRRPIKQSSRGYWEKE
jgi:hypothetical protein